MPRISPAALRRAHRVSPHAATLLLACRDLPSALNELRWIREHVDKLQPGSRGIAELKVASLCRRRGRGEPLQYLLGTQPFGNLELKCRPGVLIPRPEPEAYTTHLATLIRHHARLAPKPSPSLNILDLCTGTGCIALLLYSLLHRTTPNLHIHGVDISPHAVQLSRENLQHNIRKKTISPPVPPPQSLIFSQGDIFSDALLESLAAAATGKWDVLVCNPPYISHWGFAHQTARSVRNYEPKLAQVPMVAYPGDHRPQDAFYARLLDIGARLRPEVMIFEVGDVKQALRVAQLALRHKGLSRASAGEVEVEVEIWRDWPDATPEDSEATLVTVPVGDEGGREVRIKGSGHGRSVFIHCK